MAYIFYGGRCIIDRTPKSSGGTIYITLCGSIRVQNILPTERSNQAEEESQQTQPPVHREVVKLSLWPTCYGVPVHSQCLSSCPTVETIRTSAGIWLL